MNQIEGIVLAAEAVVCVGSADEASVEPVRPTEIAALDPSREMPLGEGTHACTTMPADIEKRAQRVTPVPRNDDAFTRDLTQKIVARRRDLVCTPSADPGSAVETLQFSRKRSGSV